jgi:hypothetical protein
VALVSGSMQAGNQGEEYTVEIPKAMLVEKIRGRSGAEKANQADQELPDKVDTEADAELLSKYDLDPAELEGDFEGQSPSIG